MDQVRGLRWAKRLKFITDAEHELLTAKVDTVGRMLYGLHKALDLRRRGAGG